MLADAIAQALPGLRAEAESVMTSACTVRKLDGAWTTDPDTGEATQLPGTLVYSGPCRVRPNGATQASDRMAGGAEAFEFDYIISLPFSASAVAEGQRLTVTSSPDPALVGATVEIQKVDRGDNITARRLFCSEVV